MKQRLWISVITIVLVGAGTCLADEKPKPAAKAAPAGAPSQEEMMKAWMAAATPGDAHKKLEPFVGSFMVKTKMWMDPSKPSWGCLT